jgi:hypothetical protein
MNAGPLFDFLRKDNKIIHPYIKSNPQEYRGCVLDMKKTAQEIQDSADKSR